MISYTNPIDLFQAEQLRNVLGERGFEFFDKQWALWAAKKSSAKVSVAIYEKGPKIHVQGKGTEEFVKFILEPEILGEARLGNEEAYMPEMFEPHFGIDESGKGDYLGPLVVAGVYVNKTISRTLLDSGIMDSKRIAGAAKIKQLAEVIRSVQGVQYEVIKLKPETYNELYAKFGNLNRMLAWAHAKVISSLAVKVPACPRALSDQFARKELLEGMLSREHGVSHIELEQRTRAESDVAVAAASILAREAFVDWIERAEIASKHRLPLGANSAVVESAKDIVSQYGKEMLPKIAKMHFKTTQQVIEQ